MSSMLSAHAANRKSTIFEKASIVFFGLLTFGILPVAFYGHAHARRRRYSHFLVHGLEANGEIRAMETETTSFGNKESKVSYDFVVDGEVYRNADRVPQSIAERWAPGDHVTVLYIPEENHDSVIVSR